MGFIQVGTKLVVVDAQRSKLQAFNTVQTSALHFITFISNVGLNTSEEITGNVPLPQSTARRNGKVLMIQMSASDHHPSGPRHVSDCLTVNA